ncbi:MAG: ATP-binding cassette domain-containing protein [Bacteroidales bacterium]|nr:ATP-binding cassette domain-containing protein [Bacteroidales bacterium]
MISVENISLQFTGQVIFDSVTFMIKPGDRIGLVGKNGAGKTTLLKLLVNEQLPDSGKVVLPGNLTVGYLPQHLNVDDSKTVFDEAYTAFSELTHLENEISRLNEEIASRTDYESQDYMEMVERVSEKNDRLAILQEGSAEAATEQTLTGLGFERKEFTRPTKELSGGWRMRVELAKILLRSPDVFLLDEPTNHLDIESIQWLEAFLSTYRGAVVLISHDRKFLDNVTNRTIEISLGKIYDYPVAYTAYVERRKERKEQQLAAYKNQQKQIDDINQFVERFRYKATKANQVQSRVKQLEKMEIIEVDEDDVASMNIKFPPAPRSGTIVYKAKDLTKKYGEKLVLEDISIAIERGEKVAFIGKNGEGKTTLSRIIMNEIESEGESILGHNVNIGYFAQNQEQLLDGNCTVFDTLDRVAVGDIRTKIRDILGAFLFSGEDVDKKVKVLSGGEKSRLSMAKLLLEPYNLLVLDEPTNHLDMRSKDILKNALLNFDGTFIVVSHDRDFLDGLVDKIYEFRNHKIKEYRGGIYDFLGKRKLDSLDQLNVKKKQVGVKEEKKSSSKLSYEQRKEMDRVIRKVKNELGKIEEDIQSKEEEIGTMEAKLASGEGVDDQLYVDYEKLKKEVENSYSLWEIKSEEVNKLEQQREK